jgi:hypothetical protein
MREQGPIRTTLMTKQPKKHPEARYVPVTAALTCAALAFTIVSLSACGRADKAGAASEATTSSRPSSAASSGPQGSGTESARTAPAAPEAKPINLRNLAILDGGEMIGRSRATLSYKAKGDAKSGYEFHRQQLLALGWKEEPNASVTEQAASGTFNGTGYTISASAFPGSEPGSITVMLHNHGNVNLAALPLPPGTKPVYVGPLNAMHVTDLTVENATATVRTLLAAAGWEPHGGEANSSHFIKGLNRLSATISSAPAQGGKTMITYSSILLPGDLPAPPDAEDVRYAETRQEVTYATPSGKEEIVAFYVQKLAETGWKQNDEQALRVDDYDQMVFRTPAGEAIFLKIKLERQGKRNVSLSYLSVEDIEDLKKVKPPVPRPAEKE